MFLLKKKCFLTISLLIMVLSLSACSNKGETDVIDNNTEATTDNAESTEAANEDSAFESNINYADLAGEYQDTFSQRASMSAEDMGDCLKLTVYWSSSASESSIWTMTAKFTAENTLSYTDGEYGIIVFDEEDNDTYTKEYDSAEGYFTLIDGKLHWDGAADESCRDCVFEHMDFDVTDNGGEIWYVAEDIDIYNLADGTYPVKIFFDEMKKNQDSLSLDFMIYTVIHYAPEDIRTMTQGDILYEYVDETTTNNYVIDTVNFPLEEVCVVNGGSERGEGITLTEDESGYFRVSVNEVYTRNASHGIVTMELPDTVAFEDNHALANTSLQGSKLYEYFQGLSDTEKEYFNENNTFLTIKDGKVAGLQRVYLP